MRSMSAINTKPIMMTQTKSFSMLTPVLTPRLASTTPTTRMMATKSDQELGKFLIEEVSTEKKNQRSMPKLDGWTVKTDGSEITLTKEWLHQSQYYPMVPSVLNNLPGSSKTFLDFSNNKLIVKIPQTN